MKKMKLPVIITRDEDGYYVAEVPVPQSCFTQGKTREEALSNIKEVIQLCLKHMAKEAELDTVYIESYKKIPETPEMGEARAILLAEQLSKEKW